MKKKLVFIGLIFMFIFSMQFIFQTNSNPILMNNPKLATDPNFEAISESEYATRWGLSNTTEYEDFHDDIASGYWDLYGVGERYFLKSIPNSGNYLLDNYTTTDIYDYSGTHFDVYADTNEGDPTDITWDGTHLWIIGYSTDKAYKYTTAGVYTGTNFDISVQDNSPMGITWDGTYFWVVGYENDEVYKYTSAGVYTGTHFDVGAQETYPEGIIWDGTYFWVVGRYTDEVYKYTSAGVYTGTHFDVGAQEPGPYGITWDGTYFWIVGSNRIVYQYNAAGTYTGTHWDVYEEAYPEGITWDGTYFWVIGLHDEEVYQYERLNKVFKNYYGSGYAYIQTDTTETVGLISPTYGSTYNLSAGDYFKINCKPMTSNKIELKLYKSDVLQKTITVVPQDNTNYNTRDIEVSVDEYVEFDQILFTGTLENTKYFKVFDIKTYKYESTGVSFYLAPYERRAFSIFEDDYTLKIYELDALKVEKDITITSSLHTEIYSPIGTIECRLSLFSQENDPLDFSLFHINITRTLNNNTDTYPLLNNIFVADIETEVTFEIWDRFDNSIKNDSMVARSFIDIVIDIYSLKIKNEYENYVPYALKNNDTDVVKSGNIFSDEIVEFLMGSGTYIFNYSKNDDDYSVVINFNDNQILVINSSKICLLSYANQRGEYLFFYNYKTYINGSLIYRNDIYREIGDNVSVEVKDRYDISIKNESFIVNITDNYFSIILTEYSLKVCNQQEKFNHINITRDPNYYESENYWSEWMAPNEIIKFYLFPGYYKINVTNVEDESYSYYSYTFNGDDMLLLTSDNTIANAIINIQNVNTTIGNQITNVEINITNQNSAINNTVVSITINLDNINSTLGDLLITQSIQITNIENNLNSLYIFTNNSFINLNSSINTYFINIENNIISINDTISNLIIGMDNDIVLINTSISALIAGISTDISLINTSVSTLILDINNDIVLINQSISNLVIDIDNNVALINGTISTLIMDIGNDLMIMNSMIDTSFFFLNTTIAEIGNNITANTIFLNNSIFVTGNWINDSRIAILNNLALINNTIMTGINQIYTSVYLINNSIYTAVIDLGTSLTLENNKITGNLSIILQQNDFLTAIYNKTMFSELLNWSGVGYNFSIMEDRIDVFKFINEYKSQSVEILLKYQDKVESMILSAQNSLNQWLPKENVEYRLKSVATGKYLTDWEEMPEDKTVSFGFYETEIPAEPEPIDVTVLTVFIFFLFVSVIISIVLGVFVYLQSEQIKTLKLYRKLKRSGII